MTIVLACVAGLLGVSALSLVLVRHRAAYGGRLRRLPGDLACIVRESPACPSAEPSSEIVLPLGLPWLGAHFRLDPLAAAFLAIINFGAASASFYALGYGRHEAEPARVLPFYPAFLAAHESRGRRRRRLQLPVRLGAHVAGVMGARDGAPSRGRRRPMPDLST